MSVTVKWRGAEYFRLIVDGLKANMERATGVLEREVKRRLKIGQPIGSLLPTIWKTGLQPSRPLQPPKSLSGGLRKFIRRKVFFTRSGFEKDALVGQVISGQPYSKVLELGRKGGGRIIRPKRSKALIVPIRRQSVANAQLPLFQKRRGRPKNNVKFLYRKFVRMGDIAPRPFMMPSLEDKKALILKHLRRRLKLPVPKTTP